MNKANILDLNSEVYASIITNCILIYTPESEFKKIKAIPAINEDGDTIKRVPSKNLEIVFIEITGTKK